MIQDVTIPARLLTCDQCTYTWISIANRIPTHCMSRECRSREWNGKKERKPQEPKPKIVLPPPLRVRGGDDED